MVKRDVPLCFLALLVPLAGTSAEINFDTLVAPEAHVENKTSPYYVGPPTVEHRRYSSRQDFKVRVKEGGLTAEGVARWQKTEGLTDDYRWVTNQLYYDGQFAPGLGWSVGRKVLSWGVGFAFRPLDVIQRENRRQVNASPLVGIPLVALELFSPETAWTLVWSNPAKGNGSDDHRSEGVALRWYRFSDNNDYHGVARISDRHRLELGAGATTVIGEEWSVYGAGLYQHRYTQITNSLLNGDQVLSTTNPMIESTRKHGVNFVAGGQWTGSNGWSLLAEAFYDSSAYSASEWRHLNRLTQRQLTLLNGIPATWSAGNIAWSSQAYAAPNLARENLLLRASYDDSDGFKPYAELLLAVRDGGVIGTIGASYEQNRHKFAVGFRQLGGASNSIFANAPEMRVLWLQWGLSI